MKTIAMVLILGLLYCLETSAQHVPPCQGSAHSTSICWGYATGRAFSKTWSDTQCPLSTLYLLNINTTYFDYYDGGSLSGIQGGDIVVFGINHAAFVTQTNADISQIKVDQVPNTGGLEQTGVFLYQITPVQGPATGYYRKKPLWSILVQNSFAGGKVGVGGQEFDSPFTLGNLYWNQGVGIDAVMDGRTFNGYVRRFNKWTKGGGQTNFPKSTTTYTDNYNYSTAIDHKAFLDREFNVTFQNSLPGASGGTVKVSTITQNAPYVAHVIEINPSITAEAINQDINRVSYTFSSWSPGGSTTAITTFSITDHITYTANFTAKPWQAENCYAGGVVGNPVQITWTRHPNTSVTYQIYRRVKPLGGSTGSETLIASLSNATTSYTDNDYLVTSTYSNDLLSYDVRSYLNGVYSDPNFVQVFGRMNAKRVEDGDLVFMGGELPTEYKISNYPKGYVAKAGEFRG